MVTFIQSKATSNAKAHDPHRWHPDPMPPSERPLQSEAQQKNIATERMRIIESNVYLAVGHATEPCGNGRRLCITSARVVKENCSLFLLRLLYARLASSHMSTAADMRAFACSVTCAREEKRKRKRAIFLALNLHVCVSVCVCVCKRSFHCYCHCCCCPCCCCALVRHVHLLLFALTHIGDAGTCMQNGFHFLLRECNVPHANYLLLLPQSVALPLALPPSHCFCCVLWLFGLSPRLMLTFFLCSSAAQKIWKIFVIELFEMYNKLSSGFGDCQVPDGCPTREQNGNASSNERCLTAEASFHC